MPHRIGPYEVKGEIGRGGMGVVYLAHDPNLGRDVAVKALPDDVAGNPERLARFQREARLLASLHHSNIAVVYGLEVADGVHYLILEHVEGEDLDRRLSRGPLPLDDAIAMGRQIAEALEAAHGGGIIHRDLKPANVKITSGGRVKVLDFGLAKSAQDQPAPSDVHSSPTVTSPRSPTVPGVILGTAGYMSPEQARGKPVDKRTDIWSFGCVLYEAMTGAPAFGGETVTDCIAATLRGEPDWQALPADTPPRLTQLLHRCMTRDPDKRLHDIADARVELEEIAGDSALMPAGPTPRRAPGSRSRVIAAILAVALVVSLAGHLIVYRSSPVARPDSSPAHHVAIALPPGESIQIIGQTVSAISPDGNLVAFVSTPEPGLPLTTARRRGVVGESDGRGPRMLVQSLVGDPVPRVLPGTEGAVCPFFSPDGRWIGYIGAGGLRKVPVSGGVSVLLAPSSNGVGGCWGRDGTIVYAPHWRGGLWRIHQDGGEPREFTRLDPSNNEASHRWPHLLPDGKSVLFTIKTRDLLTFDDAQIAVASLETGEHRVILEGGMSARYCPTGHIVFCRHSAVYTAPFDLGTLQVTGSSVPVLEGVETDSEDGSGHISISDNGSLLYVPDDAGQMLARDVDLVWVDRQGNETQATSERREYGAPAISPDALRIACDVGDANGNLWIGEAATGTFSRLTFGSGNNLTPVWTPDGSRVAFFSDREGTGDIYWMNADGSGQAERLYRGSGPLPASFSPEGSVLLFVESGDIWQLPLDGDRRAQPLLATRFDEGNPEFSRDGRWIAYTSDESGQGEVYLLPFPGPGGKVRVSYGGGQLPRWSRDGAELFYVGPDALTAVEIRTEPPLRVGTPTKLFKWEGIPETNAVDAIRSEFDVAPDGRFLLVKAAQPELYLRHLGLVLNVFEELQRTIPAR